MGAFSIRAARWPSQDLDSGAARRSRDDKSLRKSAGGAGVASRLTGQRDEVY